MKHLISVSMEPAAGYFISTRGKCSAGFRRPLWAFRLSGFFSRLSGFKEGSGACSGRRRRHEGGQCVPESSSMLGGTPSTGLRAIPRRGKNSPHPVAEFEAGKRTPSLVL